MIVFCSGLMYGGEHLDPVDPARIDPARIEPHLPDRRIPEPVVPPVEPPRIKPVIPAAPVVDPVIPGIVEDYLGKAPSVPTVVRTTFSDFPLKTLADVRTNYLVTLEADYKSGSLVDVPLILSNGVVAPLSNGQTLTLVRWMIFLTDGLSFAEQLSQAPGATEAQRQQFAFSPDQQSFYESSRNQLITASQNFLTMVQNTYGVYGGLFTADGGIKGVLSQGDIAALPDTIEALDALAEDIVQQRENLLRFLQETSPLANDAFLETVVVIVDDSQAAINAWAQQEGLFAQDVKSNFPSFGAFMNDFSLITAKQIVTKYVGLGKSFSSVQDLITALDKIQFILEKKGDFAGYSSTQVASILSFLLGAYPGTFLPSQRFILSYRAKNGLLRPITDFISNYSQFVIDAQTFTVDALAKKYGQGPDFTKSLLTKVYQAAYVLRATGQTAQLFQLEEIMREIALLYPDLIPSMLDSLDIVQSLSIQTLLNSQSGLLRMMEELRSQLVDVQSNQLAANLAGFSIDFSHAQDMFQAAQTSTEAIFSTLATIGFLEKPAIDQALSGVVNQLKKAKDALAIIVAIQEKSSGQIYDSGINERYKMLAEKIAAARQDLLNFGLDTERRVAEARVNLAGNALLNAIKENFGIGFPPKGPEWLNFFSSEEPTTSDAAVFDEVDALIDDLITGAAERENESDFKACIWASNKVGVMESRLNCILLLIKVKHTQLFLDGYKDVLRNIKADLEVFSTRKVMKCYNIASERYAVSQKIQEVEIEIANVEKEEKDAATGPVTPPQAGGTP